MNKLLELSEDGKVVITAEALQVKEFKRIWTRDRDNNKKYAREELAFVYFLVDYQSPYSSMDREERLPIIIDDVITKSKWKPDDAIKEACEKYEKLQTTFSMQFLRANKGAAFEVKRFLESIDLHALDKNGKPMYKVNDIIRAMGETVKVIESIDKWEERVRKEIDMQDTKIRGGGVEGDFENPDTAVWLKNI